MRSRQQHLTAASDPCGSYSIVRRGRQTALRQNQTPPPSPRPRPSRTVRSVRRGTFQPTLSIRTARPMGTWRRDSWTAEVDEGSRTEEMRAVSGVPADCCWGGRAAMTLMRRPNDWCTRRRVSGRPTFDQWYVVWTPASACPVPTRPLRPAVAAWCRLLYGSVNRFHCPVPRTPGLKFTPDRANWSTLTAEMEIGFTPASLEMPSQLNNELNENFPARPLQEGTSPWHAAIVPRPADRDATRFFKSIKIRGRILSPANTVWYAFGRICLRVCL